MTTDMIIDAAADVTEELGGGLRENAYHQALLVALADEGMQFTTEATIPVLYRGFPVSRLHPDLIVGDAERHILELKVNRDGTEQLTRYLDYAARNEMDTIVGGIMLSFGDDLETNVIDHNT